MHAVVGHGHGLGIALGFVVHAPGAHRVDVSPVALRLRVHLGVSVHLGRGCQQEAGLLRLGQPKCPERPQRAHLERMDRVVEVVLGRCRRGEVQDPVDGALREEVVGHVVALEPEPLVLEYLREVPGAPRQEGVEADD